MSTIEESVWETLRRDLLAVWEKMRLVLYPKFLLGGILNRGGGGVAGDRAESEGLMGGAAGGLGHIRGLVGRWPDADAVLQGGMSEGLRDWDLWYAHTDHGRPTFTANMPIKGPATLLPSALLSLEYQRARLPALACLQWCFRYNLDLGGNHYPADQASRRQHVRLNS